MTLISRKIVCVDDDTDDLSFLTDAILELDPSFEVIEFKNGVEAIDYLSTAKETDNLPCLILLDMNMPLLDGKQTLEKIRTDLRLDRLPVVIFTSSENPNDKMLFKQKGVDMFTKPFTVTELHGLVQKFLLYCD